MLSVRLLMFGEASARGLKTTLRYGSTVTATRKGWPGGGLSDSKSNWRIGTSGEGFSQVVLKSRMAWPARRGIGLLPTPAMTKLFCSSLGRDHPSSLFLPLVIG